jgi:hypothetical protein
VKGYRRCRANVSSGSSPPLACYSRSDGGCCARVFDHRQLRSACRSGRHDSDRLKRWFMRTPLTSSTTSGVGCESACWASIHPKARLHRRLLGSGGKRVREIDPAWATSRLRHRSEPGHVRTLRPDLAYLDKADGWDYSVEAAPVRVLPIPMSITAIPRPEPTRLQLPNRKRRPLAGACGDRRASAKRRQSQSDSPRCASAKRSRCARGAALSWPRKLPGRGCRRAGVHRGSRGVVPVYGWG